MSGGYFGNVDRHFREVADKVKEHIDRNEIPPSPDDDWGMRYFTENGNKWYSDETMEAFKRAYECIRMAETYAHRIDWLLSDDDGEETFHERLHEDIGKLINEISGKWQAQIDI